MIEVKTCILPYVLFLAMAVMFSEKTENKTILDNLRTIQLQLGLDWFSSFKGDDFLNEKPDKQIVENSL